MLIKVYDNNTAKKTNTVQIMITNAFYIFLVDCEYGPWSFSSCNATCGASAFRTKSREIVTQAAHGGAECNGEKETVENCDLSQCPSKF